VDVGYRPPKGVRPPRLKGRRTGRPKGSKNHARAWADAWANLRWGYEHRSEDRGSPPSQEAHLWWRVAADSPDAVRAFLAAWRQL
jgi:hypothetical protein